MQLGIDLGLSYTTVALQSDSGALTFIEPIPSMLGYLPGLKGVFCGRQAQKAQAENKAVAGSWGELLRQQNPALARNDCDFEQVAIAYFTHLTQQLGTWGEQPITRVTLSVPYLSCLRMRCRLYTALQNVFAKAAVILVPEPLATFWGYQLLHPQDVLKGEVLIIDASEGTIDFSFLSLGGADEKLILERQLQFIPPYGSPKGLTSELPAPFWQQLSSYLETTLQPKAQYMGLFTKGKWELHHIILLGDLFQSPGLYSRLESFFAGIPLHRKDISHPYPAAGSCAWNEAYWQNSYTIYPFRFYIEQKSQSAAKEPGLEQIPFDTANLELNLSGYYPILSIAPKSPYNLSDKKGFARLKIYELPAEAVDKTLDSHPDREMALDYRGHLDDADTALHIALDMRTSQLVVSSKAVDKDYEVDLFSGWTERQVAQAEWLSDYKYIDKGLIAALQTQLETNAAQEQTPYGQQAAATYYKLICLLQILNP